MRLANRWLLLLVALLGVGFAPVPRAKPRPKAPTAKEELKKLQGTWEYVSVFTRKGWRDVAPGPLLVIKGDRASEVRAGQVTTRWRVTLDPSKTPKAMDLKNAEGKGGGLLCVYEVEGDSLTLCYGSQPAKRPADVKARQGVTIDVLKRVKKP